MHMYVWSRPPVFIAVAQAENVEGARAAVLEEIGETGDGSCPEREKARKWVRENNPAIWHGANAQFALTDSAELIEVEAECEKLRNRAKRLAAAILERAKLLHGKSQSVLCPMNSFEDCQYGPCREAREFAKTETGGLYAS